MTIVRPVIGTLAGKVHRDVEEAIRRTAAALNDHQLALERAAALLTDRPSPMTLAAIRDALQATGSHPLTLTGLPGLSTGPTRTSTPTPTPPPPPPAPGVCQTSLPVGQPAGIPAAPNLRWWRGNFSGIRVPGLPAVPGGSSDTSLVFTPFIDRYSLANRQLIYGAYAGKGLTHFVMSWPDSVSFGTTPGAYAAIAQEVQLAGFYPVHFLNAKGNDPNAYNAFVQPCLTALQAIGPAVIPAVCVAWESNLWMSPTQLQNAINFVAGAVTPPTTNVYVHFSSGYFAWQQPGGVTADFWNLNVGKLTGLLFQRDLSLNCPDAQARYADGLSRFAGNFGFAHDSGFGHPFDYVAWETSAFDQFFNGLSEAGGNLIGFNALCTPAVTGPAGTVPVYGFGNGATNPDGSRL